MLLSSFSLTTYYYANIQYKPKKKSDKTEVMHECFNMNAVHYCTLAMIKIISPLSRVDASNWDGNQFDYVIKLMQCDNGKKYLNITRRACTANNSQIKKLSRKSNLELDLYSADVLL